LAKFLGFFRLSLVRKIFAMLDAQTSANILLHMDELKRAQILRGLDTRKSANILFRMMPADLEIAAKTLRSPFLEANKQAQIIAAITLIDQGRAEVIRAPLVSQKEWQNR
jgi:flagellar motility protein MotE (MotC chaperone)